MSSRSRTIHLEVEGRFATLTLDRPPLNVLDLGMIDRLDACLEEVSTLEGLQGVFLQGAGHRAFSAGVAIEDHTPEKVEPMLLGFHRALRRLFALEVITIAAIDGHCLGGGMELAACCDVVMSTPRSTFGQPEIELGCFPPVAAALYPSLLGPARSADLLLTGRRISAAEAQRMGFVARIAEEGLVKGVAELRDDLGSKSAVALRLTKKALRAGSPRPELLEEALAETERIYLEELARCDDLEEGVRAFLDKRQPVWSHA